MKEAKFYGFSEKSLKGQEVSMDTYKGKTVLVVTPLLKRMEGMEIISRRRSMADERKVLITLTEKGRKMRDEAAAIPQLLVEELQEAGITAEELMELKQRLDRLVEHLKEGSDLFF